VVQLEADMSPTTDARLTDIDAAVDFLEQYRSETPGNATLGCYRRRRPRSAFACLK
jgi:hypothetical protein